MTELHFDVIGAHGPTQFFSRLSKETIGHAYLFSGPEGVGKKTFARRLAQSLLCEVPKDGVIGYDGTCNSCRLIGREETRHPDLLESIGALKIGDTESALGFHESEEITARDLVRQLSLQSYSGGFRVFILGDIDFVTHHAANALLKFFEEPPPHVVLLLTSSTPGRLLTTIRSRLIELRFPTLKNSEVAEILRLKGYDEAQTQLGAALSQGSVTRAVAALDEEESLRAGVADWFFQCVDGQSPEETWATRETLDEGLEIVKTLVRDWVAISTVGRDARVLAVDYRDRLTKLPAIAAERSTTILSKLTDAQRLARTNVSPALVGEFVRMNITGAT
ncbi:MAG: DNA polymerase III subunit delta' [Candidatus Eremiobacteraeota bacterium]|nr:DNA polymerase III subunit delta' [Candidatus Eremiobacteraeota bacterium]